MDTLLSISEIQEGLVNKKFTAVELVDQHLRRIEMHDKKLNAFITISDEEAYEQAKKADEIIKQSGSKAFVQYPLLGVVTAFKDLYLTKGIRTTAGSKVLENYIPAYSATVVTKVERAGGIVIGKTNCDAWAHGASGENSDFGSTKNPWNSRYVSGGSSSGSAAAVAAGLVPLAFGTDTGGSIRQPANFCGVVGLKPTYGAVSRYGVVAMASSLDSMGHITQTVEDAEKVFGVTRGEDGLDGTVVNSELKTQNSKLRIGVPKEYFVEGLNREVEKAVLSAADVFKKGGVELVDISLPHTKYAISVYYIVAPAEVSSNLGRYDGIRYGVNRDVFGDEAKRRIMLGTYVLSAGYYDAYYLKAMKVRSKIVEDFDTVFNPSAEGVDAILAPVSPTPAFKIGEKSTDPMQMYLADIFTVAANLAGIPGLAIPVGFGSAGLPLGFQLLGPRFGEQTLFELGKRYQQAIDWEPKQPSLQL